MRNIKVAFFIAYKSILKGNKSTLSLIIFILSLSVLNMMFISGILFGLQELMKGEIISSMTSHITISPQETPQLKPYILNQNEVRAQIESIPGITATARRYVLAGSIAYDKEKNGVLKSISAAIMGIDPDEDKKIFKTQKKIVDGQALTDTDRDQIVLSSALAGGYDLPAPADLGGAKVGDKVQVTYSNGIQKTYTVKGVYDDKLGIYQNFISAKEAESILSVFNNASQIFVTADLDRAPIEKYQAKVKGMQPSLTLKNYNVLLGSFASFLNALDLIAGIVSAISILVAAITIFVLIYVNAVNKRRQIGILKAIGIKKEIIILSYVFQSLFYAFCGVVIGSILVFMLLTPLLERYPIDVAFGLLSLAHKPSEIISGTVSLMIAGLVAGYIPARIIAKQDILKAIWG